MVMSSSGSFTFTRTHDSDCFYYPPLVHIHRQLQLQQQRTVRSEPETWTDKDDSALSRHNSSCSSFPNRNTDTSNLNRLLESITPIVPAQLLPEARPRRWRTREGDGLPSFCLGDLWESFREWSVYGVGVPLLMNGIYSVKQYYVPFLLGIQLYIDPHKLRRPVEDGNAEFSRDTRGVGNSDCEAERLAKNIVDGAWVQQNRINLNSQRLRRLTLRDRPPICSFKVTEDCSSGGCLYFEYFEQEKPYDRPPLYDEVSNLASQFPDLWLYKSCDLLPSSWVSVTWYPIYRIPVGPTLQSQDASFLTFHSLSTHSRGKNQ